MSTSEYTPAELVIRHCRLRGYPKPTSEHYFCRPVRMFRFDFAWPDFMLAFEIDGTCSNPGASRHTTNAGFSEDLVKLNEAVLRGWRVLRATPQQIRKGTALGWIDRAMGQWRAKT